MTSFFKPYEGNRPFFFVSYAHRQSDAVVGTIRLLHEKGWRLWYDEGIPAGSDWPANIAQHMLRCERVIFFLSERSLESPNCFSEMRTAHRLGKRVLTVRLEDADIPPEWRELLEGGEEIPQLPTPAERAEAILRSGFLPRRLHRSWSERVPWRALGLAVSLGFFLSASAALGALSTGRWSPVPTPELPAAVTPGPTAAPTPVPTVPDLGEAQRYFAVKFPDTQQERAVRRTLELPSEEVYRWQLAEIPALYFCGGLYLDDADHIRFDADGTCRVNGAPVAPGQVADLSLFAYMLRLEDLALVRQPLGDLSGLSGHVLLRRLNLSGSTVESLGALRELPSLETLCLEHTAVRDLTGLDRFEHLKTVTVSRDMLPMTWEEDAPFRVVLIAE